MDWMTWLESTSSHLPIIMSCAAIGVAGWGIKRWSGLRQRELALKEKQLALFEELQNKTFYSFAPPHLPSRAFLAHRTLATSDSSLLQPNLPISQTFLAIPYRYRDTIAQRVMAAGTTGILIGPGVDIPALIAIWVEGTLQIAEMANFNLTEDMAVALITAVFAAGATWMAAGTALKTITFLIPVANIAVNGFVNAFYTYRYLKAISNLFDNPDAYGDIAGEIALEYISGILGNHWPDVMVRDINEVATILDLFS